MSTAVLASALGAALTSTSAAETPAAQPVGARAETLLHKMTLAEKIGQLTQQPGGEIRGDGPQAEQGRQELDAAIREGRVGSFLNAHGAEYTNRLQRIAVEESCLGIPLLLGNDVIHGYRTIFPIPLGEAASWDPQLIERAARVAAREAAAAGTHWTFAPMVDVCRDPRWGRIAEGAGEDPYLGSVLAAARVRGFQGADLASPDTLLACAKHYVAYGGAEGGRDYNTVDISPQTLREVYLPPFKAAVDAGAGTLMSAFNEISGVPASANYMTLTHLLRGEWGFDGFVVSDFNSIGELVPHGFAAHAAEAATKALSAGVDMDMCSFAYREHLAELVHRGEVSVETVDQAVRRILRLKVKLGLFERPYVDPQRAAAVTLTDENRATAHRLACASIVMLKNDGGLLPLRDTIKSIAVIGPLADSRRDPLGTWAGLGNPDDVVTALAGIRERAPAGTVVRHATGCDVEGHAREGFAEALQLAGQSEVVVLVVGESENMSGEAHCRSSLNLPGVQEELIRAVHATGTPVVVVLMNGRPLSIEWTVEHVPAILETWHLGVECGRAVADVLFGHFNPAGRLPVTFPRRVGQVPIYYNHKNTGRPPSDDRFTSKYLDLPSTPLFPFGYGLSYTTFEYSHLRLSAPRMCPDGRIEVHVDVQNTGRRPGDEVVQLYTRDLVASMTRPVRELKGFKRITLQTQEKRTVTFALEAGNLGFYNQQVKHVVEPGLFKLWVGPNSVDGLEVQFEVTGN